MRSPRRRSRPSSSRTGERSSACARTSPTLGAGTCSAASSRRARSLLDGLRRELREETGLEIEPGNYLGAYADTYGESGTAVLNLVFEARVVDGDMAPADDVADLRWFDLDDLPAREELAFRWVSRFLDDVKSSAPA